MKLSSLRDLELRMLKTQLDYVRKSKFYNEKLKASLHGTANLTSVRDMEKLPFTIKDELRASQKSAPPFGGHQACDRSVIKRIYMTSGTTGTPTFVGLTNNDIADWIECASRSYWAAGFRQTNWVVSALGAGPFIA